MDFAQILHTVAAYLLLSTALQNIKALDYIVQLPKVLSDIGTQPVYYALYASDEVSEQDDDEVSEQDDDEVSEQDDDEVSEQDDDEVSEQDDDEVSEQDDDEVSEHDDSKFSISDLLIPVFMLCTNLLHSTYTLCSAMYTFHPASKQAIDILSYAGEHIRGYYQHYRVEPFCPNWVCIYAHTQQIQPDICYIMFPEVPMKTTQLDEAYECMYIDTTQVLALGAFSKIMHQTLSYIPDILRTPNLIDCLLLCKYDDRYISRVITNKVGPELVIETAAKRSRVSFLSVEYTHPSLPAPIMIDLPRNMFYVGNDLLSAAFIKRHLEYRHNHYVLNDEYTLNIMDNMMNIIKLDTNKYIRLSERTFEIRSIGAD
jgi:hypothetical protein